MPRPVYSDTDSMYYTVESSYGSIEEVEFTPYLISNYERVPIHEQCTTRGCHREIFKYFNRCFICCVHNNRYRLMLRSHFPKELENYYKEEKERTNRMAMMSS